MLFFCFYLYLHIRLCIWGAWPTESRLPIQSGYRSELYDAGDYVDEYQELLRDELGGQVSDLYTQAAALETQEASVGEGLNLEQDRKQYVEGEEGEEVDFAANSEILMPSSLWNEQWPTELDSEIQQAEQTLAAWKIRSMSRLLSWRFRSRSHRMQSTMHTKWCSRQKIC
ncbi:MAG: hypothetical protein ACLSB9_21950 [Hydrogeniiclostridium mannosilyticum]